MLVDEYDSAVLSCKTLGDKGSSSPSFKWRREGGAFTLTKEYSFRGSEYAIDNVTREDAGRYFCTAVSSQGLSHETFLFGTVVCL